MDIALVLTCGLVVWRLAHMLQDEEGPGAIFSRLQAWVYSRKDTPGGLYRGFSCFYCLSVWVALPVALLADWLYPTSWWLLWLASSTIAIFINLVHIRLED